MDDMYNQYPAVEKAMIISHFPANLLFERNHPPNNHNKIGATRPKNKLTNPSTLFPHPSPNRSYKLSAKSGNPKPIIVRTKADAPVALAA